MSQVRESLFDNRYYSTDRDLAHLFPFLVKGVAGWLEDGVRWAVLERTCQREKVDASHLTAALTGLVRFVRAAADSPSESMESCLERSGYLDAPAAAQAAVMATVGKFVLGATFVGVREATVGDRSKPALACPELEAAAGRAARYLGMTAWSRFLFRCRVRLGGAWRALRGEL